MPKNVYVAIWHLDTRADPGPDEPDWPGKFLALERKVDAALRAFERLGADGEPDAIRLFAAPEYYFAMGGDLIRGYSAYDKDNIKRSLAVLSGTYPRMILVPGTIAWKEQLDRTERRQVAAHLQQVIDDAAGTGGGYRGEVVQARNNIRTGKSLLKSNSAKRWFGHNTACIYSGGVEVGELNKSTNAGEFSGEDPNDRVVMIPGFRSGKFEMPFAEGTEPGEALTVGVEICGDHGRLHNTFGERVDIHVLVSASQRPGSPGARRGGLFVHADNQERPIVHRSQMIGDGPFYDRERVNWGADNIIDDDPDLYICKAVLEDAA